MSKRCLHIPFFFFPYLFLLVTLRHSFLANIPHPLANCLAPNPNGRCSPLSFESLIFSICLPCLHFMHFFQPFSCVPTVFQNFSSCKFPHFPNYFLDFLGFSKLAIHFFLQFNCFVHNFPPFSSISTLFLIIFLHFPQFFPTFFLPFSGDLGRIKPHRNQIA